MLSPWFCYIFVEIIRTAKVENVLVVYRRETMSVCVCECVFLCACVCLEQLKADMELR